MGKFQGGGGVPQKPKNLKGLEFPEGMGGGGGESLRENPFHGRGGGRYGYFLQLHITIIIYY